MSLHQANKDQPRASNAATFASALTYTTTALPVGRLAREMTPVSPLKLPVKCVRLFLMNN